MENVQTVNAAATAQTNNTVLGTFLGTLKSIDSTVLQNRNGKNYKRVVVAITNAAGATRDEAAIIYEGNYSKGELKVGEKYLTTLSSDTQGNAYLQVSHLQSDLRSSVEDLLAFGITGLKKTTVAVTMSSAEAMALAMKAMRGEGVAA